MRMIPAMTLAAALLLAGETVRADDPAPATETAKTPAATPAVAPAATPQPATPPAASAPETATATSAQQPPATVCTVTDVQRTVMWQLGQNAKPQAMKVGDKLPLGADICTGLRSTCRLVFNDDACVVDVKPMSMVRIGEFSRDGDKVRTRIYLKQGTVQADVEPTRFTSDFAVVSPEATLAVHGTHGIHATQHRDTGFTGQLLGGGLLYASTNQPGRGQFVGVGDQVGSGMNPPILTLHNGSLVPLYALNGLTSGEFDSANRGGQTWFGPGQNFGPGGMGHLGGYGRLFSFSQQGLSLFYLNNPNRLPNYVPPPPSPHSGPCGPSGGG